MAEEDPVPVQGPTDGGQVPTEAQLLAKDLYLTIERIEFTLRGWLADKERRALLAGAAALEREAGPAALKRESSSSTIRGGGEEP